MCKVPSIDSQPTWREKENKNTYGDTWHWQELLINLRPSKRSYKFGDTFPYKLNLWYVGIWGAGKTEVPGENPPKAERRTNNKLNPYVASILRLNPWLHWWEGSALSTASSLLQKTYNDGLLDISVFQFRKELYFFFHSTKTNYHEQGLTHLVTARPYV